jgi:hypothetical protein
VAENALLDLEDVGQLHAAAADQLAEHDGRGPARRSTVARSSRGPSLRPQPKRVAKDRPVCGEVGLVMRPPRARWSAAMAWASSPV